MPDKNTIPTNHHHHHLHPHQSSLQLSQDGTRQFIQRLYRQGYFHKTHPNNKNKNNNDNKNNAMMMTLVSKPIESDSLDTFRLLQTMTTKQYIGEHDFHPTNHTNANIINTNINSNTNINTNHLQVIPTTDYQMFYSPRGLMQAIQHIIEQSGGRMNLSNVATQLQIHPHYIRTHIILPMRESIQDNHNNSKDNHHKDDLDMSMTMSSSSTIQQIGTDLIVPSYWDTIQKAIAEELVGRQNEDPTNHLNKRTEQQWLTISDLATRWVIPADLLIRHCLSTMPQTHCIPMGSGSGSGSGVGSGGSSLKLVSDSYLQWMQSQIVQTFQSLQEPTLVSTVCQKYGWDVEWVVTYLLKIKNQTTTDTLHPILLEGDMHVDPNSIATTMYKPHSYSQRQRQQLQDFLMTNGYITSEWATRQGLSIMQVTTLLQQQQQQQQAGLLSDLVVLTGMAATTTTTTATTTTTTTTIPYTVWIQETILGTLHEAIQEMTTTSSSTNCMDLQEVLAPDLIHPHYLSLILERIGFDTTKHGILVRTNDDQVYLFSPGTAHQIIHNILPPLVETFAQRRAKELLDGTGVNINHNSTMKSSSNLPTSSSGTDHDDEEELGRKSSSARSKRKGKKHGRISKADENIFSPQTTGVVPLLQVAGAVLKGYPNLFPDNTEQELLDQADTLSSWEKTIDGDDYEEDDGYGSSGILLVDFCKLALYTDDFRRHCATAVHAEWKRLQSARESKSTLSRKDAAARVRTVQSAFEESFIVACHMIQATAKFLGQASQSEHFTAESLAILEQEFLQGCCADLTSRVTQYCLFQNEDEEGIFSFTKEAEDREGRNPNGGETKEAETTGLPTYCIPIDTAIRHYPSVYLSCPPPREPLTILRESLPGNIGVSLARQWVLCGGQCYRGGIRILEEDDGTTQTVRPGNKDGFLSHVEENCL